MVALGFGCTVNLVESTHRNIPIGGCKGQCPDSQQNRSFRDFREVYMEAVINAFEMQIIQLHSEV